MLTKRALRDRVAVGRKRAFGLLMWERTAIGWKSLDGRWRAERWEGSYSGSDTWRVWGPGFPPEGEMFGALRRAAARILRQLEQEQQQKAEPGKPS